MGPSTSGYRLQVCDYLGPAVPDCCGQPMAGEDTEFGYREYACTSCLDAVLVAPNGIVFDIYEAIR
jgi:hypothetical protein